MCICVEENSDIDFESKYLCKHCKDTVYKVGIGTPPAYFSQVVTAKQHGTQLHILACLH